MIQRIQSIYLLITVVICALLFLFPVFIKVIPPGTLRKGAQEINFKVNVATIEIYKDKTLHSSSPDFLLLLPNVATGILSLFIIFLYKKRKLQMMLCRICILLVLIFIAVDFFYLSDAVGKTLSPDINPEYLAGSYFPFIQVILLVMALRAIKKDEELVRSADRIR